MFVYINIPINGHCRTYQVNTAQLTAGDNKANTARNDTRKYGHPTIQVATKGHGAVTK